MKLLHVSAGFPRFYHPANNSTRAIRLFIQICEAISYAHANGVIHRDITPKNIMVMSPASSVEFAKLFDFGIAKVLPDQCIDFTQDMTQTGDLCGSPLYMSPEQCKGLSLDERTDIYSLGCVMYKTLTGKHPQEGKNFVDTVVNIVTADPEPLSNVSPQGALPRGLEQVINRCLSKDPQYRYKSAASLQADLERVLDGRPISRLPRPRIRSSLCLAVASGGVMTLILAIALLLALCFQCMIIRPVPFNHQPAAKPSSPAMNPHENEPGIAEQVDSQIADLLDAIDDKKMQEADEDFDPSALSDLNDKLLDVLKEACKSPQLLSASLKQAAQSGLEVVGAKDGKLRIYEWDTKMGGTLHRVQSLVQYQVEGRTRTGTYVLDLSAGTTSDDNDSLWDYTSVHDIHTDDDKTVYLFLGETSSIDHGTCVQAYSIKNGKLSRVPFFRTATSCMDEITCWSHGCGGRNIELVDQERTLMVPVVKGDAKATGKYLIYKFDGNRFVFRGCI